MQLDKRIPEKPDRPPGPAFGRCRTGNAGQFGFEAPVEFDATGWCFAFLAFQRRVETVLHEPLFEVFEGPVGKAGGGGDVVDLPSILAELAHVQQQERPREKNLP